MFYRSRQKENMLQMKKSNMKFSIMLLGVLAMNMAGCATTREMRSDAKDIFFKQLSAKCYTTQEKINYWKGKKLLSKSPYRSFYAGDHADKRALIPLIFLSGYYDYTTPIPLSKQLLDKLEAPEKSFYTFNNSAHSPLWEENDLVIEAMLRHVR